jgi:hypothetical protein
MQMGTTSALAPTIAPVAPVAPAPAVAAAPAPAAPGDVEALVTTLPGKCPGPTITDVPVGVFSHVWAALLHRFRDT